jgi:transcriptional regulator with XRE-family HTH domain
MAEFALRDVGQRFRRLRESEGRSGREMARVCDVSQSRLSKFERGLLPLDEGELRALLIELKASDDVALRFVRDLRAVAAGRQERTPLPSGDGFEEFRNLERRSTSIDVYTCHGIPALLQTPEYTQDIVERFAPGRGSEAVAMRLERQSQLWNRSKRFCFLMATKACSYRFLDDAWLWEEQLRLILRRTQLPNVAVRVIPDDISFPWSEFAVFDSRRVYFDVPDLTPGSPLPGDAVRYIKAFRDMWDQSEPFNRSHVERAVKGRHLPAQLPERSVLNLQATKLSSN